MFSEEKVSVLFNCVFRAMSPGTDEAFFQFGGMSHLCGSKC